MKKKNTASRSLEQLRADILDILTHHAPNQLKTNELSKYLGIASTDPEYDAVNESLDALEDSGEIFRGTRRRYGVVVPETVIEGRLRMIRTGQWAIVPDEGPEIEVDI